MCRQREAATPPSSARQAEPQSLFHIATPSASPARASAPIRSAKNNRAPASYKRSIASAHAQTCCSWVSVIVRASAEGADQARDDHERRQQPDEPEFGDDRAIAPARLPLAPRRMMTSFGSRVQGFAHIPSRAAKRRSRAQAMVAARFIVKSPSLASRSGRKPLARPARVAARNPCNRLRITPSAPDIARAVRKHASETGSDCREKGWGRSGKTRAAIRQHLGGAKPSLRGCARAWSQLCGRRPGPSSQVRFRWRAHGAFQHRPARPSDSPSGDSTSRDNRRGSSRSWS